MERIRVVLIILVGPKILSLSVLKIFQVLGTLKQVRDVRVTMNALLYVVIECAEHVLLTTQSMKTQCCALNRWGKLVSQKSFVKNILLPFVET